MRTLFLIITLTVALTTAGQLCRAQAPDPDNASTPPPTSSVVAEGKDRVIDLGNGVKKVIAPDGTVTYVGTPTVTQSQTQTQTQINSGKSHGGRRHGGSIRSKAKKATSPKAQSAAKPPQSNNNAAPPRRENEMNGNLDILQILGLVGGLVIIGLILYALRGAFSGGGGGGTTATTTITVPTVVQGINALAAFGSSYGNTVFNGLRSLMRPDMAGGVSQAVGADGSSTSNVWWTPNQVEFARAQYGQTWAPPTTSTPAATATPAATTTTPPTTPATPATTTPATATPATPAATTAATTTPATTTGRRRGGI